MRYSVALVIILILIAPLVAVADTAKDIARIVDALQGGQIDRVTLDITIREDGSAFGDFTTELSALPPEKMEILMEEANRGITRQAEKLSRRGVRLNPLSFQRQGNQATITTRGEAEDVRKVPATLSHRDPIALKVESDAGLTKVRCVPRPILFLLTPFIGQLTVHIHLPDDPMEHNAAKRDGRNLTWQTKLSLPTVEFSWR